MIYNLNNKKDREKYANVNAVKATKKYVFIFEDKNGNELTRKENECISLQDAEKLAQQYEANSMLNDLHKVTVK